MDVQARFDTLDFERFRLNFSERSLCRTNDHGDSVPVALGGRAFDVLGLLVSRSGRLVPKAEIMEAVWPGAEVEESNLTVQMSALRRALDANRSGTSCIQTVPGRGYRFMSEVTRPVASERTG